MNQRTELLSIITSIRSLISECEDDICSMNYTNAVISIERVRQSAGELSQKLIQYHGRDEQDSYTTGQP